MGLLDGPMGKVASTLIGALGASAVLQRTIKDYDELEGVDVAKATTSYNVKVSPPSPFNRFEVNGSTVLADDLKCIIASSQAPGGFIDPKTDTLTIAGATYRIAGVQPIQSGDNSAAFQLTLRG